MLPNAVMSGSQEHSRGKAGTAVCIAVTVQHVPRRLQQSRTQSHAGNYEIKDHGSAYL